MEGSWVERVTAVPQNPFKLIRAAVAEFWGTLFFVFLGCGAVITATHGFQNLYERSYLDPAEVTVIAMAHGLGILLTVASTAGISGGHINPAVTLGLLSVGRIDIISSVVYIIAQVLGSVFGTGLLKAIVPTDWNGKYGIHGLAKGVSQGQGVLCEIMLSAILLFTIFGTAVDPRGPKSIAPLCIGFAIMADHFMGVGFTGASMNPARSFGPALWTGYWENQWIYWVGPILGAIIAAVVYEYTLLVSDDPENEEGQSKAV